jgi:hypothetical protein
MKKASILRIALIMLLNGYSVMPIAKKVPLIRWKEFQNRLMTEEEARRYFQMPEYVGIGLICGEISGITVLDIEKAGVGIFQEILNEIDPRTPISQSGGGGRHIYFKYSPDYKNSKLYHGGIHIGDVKNNGGYVVVPPSLHHSGKLYEWITPLGDFLPVLK